MCVAEFPSFTKTVHRFHWENCVKKRSANKENGHKLGRWENNNCWNLSANDQINSPA